MTLKNWRDNGWLRSHESSRTEIENLLRIVDRDLIDSEEGISEDWRFGIAYNAALKLCRNWRLLANFYSHSKRYWFWLRRLLIATLVPY